MAGLNIGEIFNNPSLCDFCFVIIRVEVDKSQINKYIPTMANQYFVSTGLT